MALQALVDELGAPAVDIPNNGPTPGIVAGKPTPENLAMTIAAVLPDGAVVVDESVSYGRGFFKNTHAASPHDWLQIMGGAIGFVGLAAAHLSRRWLLHDPGRVVPASALAGAALLLAADIAVRLLPGNGDIQLGVMTALIGVPVFIAIVASRRALFTQMQS